MASLRSDSPLRATALATLLFAGVLCATGSVVAQVQPGAELPADLIAEDPSADPAAPEEVPPQGDAGEAAPAGDRAPLPVAQGRIADKYERLEDLMMRLAEIEGQSNPRRAALLQQAVLQSRDRVTLGQMRRIADWLQAGELRRAQDGQTATSKDLEALLELLLSENRPDRLKGEQDRVKEYIKELERLIRIQAGIKGQTQGGVEAERLAQLQEGAAERTGALDEKIAADEGQEGEGSEGAEGQPKEPGEGEGKPSEGKPGEGMPKDAQPDEGEPGEGTPGEGMPKEGEPGEGTPKEGMPGEGKPSEGMPGEGMPGEGKPGEGKPGEGKPGEGKPGEGKPGEGKPGEGKPGEGKPGEGKPGEGSKPGDEKKPGEQSKPGESEPAEGMPSEGMPGEGKPSEGTPSEGKPSEGKPSEGKPSEGGEGEGSESESSPPPAGQEPQDQNPARKRLQAAEKKMREAKLKLEKAKRDQAIVDQEEAEAELRQAKADLEEILRQLREEEVERTLAMLETRFVKMLEMQIKVYEDTRRVDRIPAAQRGPEVEIQTGRMAFDQRKIVVEADQTLGLLREEGSSVAFPESVEQMREDMTQIAERLAAAKADKMTIAVEEDVIAALEDMIDAVRQAIKDAEEGKQPPPPPGQPGQQGDQPLVDKIAELKMIRNLQMRVNQRTDRYARLLDDADDVVGQATNEELQGALRKLSARERQIQEITRDIVMGLNQ
ncbi:MAG TPA: hypothetical protein VGN57_19430 [Pirellulaceae bacterium]|nr:hypothetical protein [Pirellulaceae bacterium]